MTQREYSVSEFETRSLKVSDVWAWCRRFWTEWAGRMFWHWHTESESLSQTLFRRDVRNNAASLAYNCNHWLSIVMIRNTLSSLWDIASRCSRSDPGPCCSLHHCHTTKIWVTFVSAQIGSKYICGVGGIKADKAGSFCQPRLWREG